MKSFRMCVAMVATVGLCTPQVATAAPPPIGGPPKRGRAIVQDVALNRDSKLTIQIVDPQGRPHAGTPIKVRKDGVTVHQGIAGSDGQIVFSQLKPGVYEIASGSRGGIYRLWAPKTAPPRTTSGILLIDEGGVVRGARGNWQNAALIGGVIITSGVLGGVIGYNIKDDAS